MDNNCIIISRWKFTAGRRTLRGEILRSSQAERFRFPDLHFFSALSSPRLQPWYLRARRRVLLCLADDQRPQFTKRTLSSSAFFFFFAFSFFEQFASVLRKGLDTRWKSTTVTSLSDYVVAVDDIKIWTRTSRRRREV